MSGMHQKKQRVQTFTIHEIRSALSKYLGNWFFQSQWDACWHDFRMELNEAKKRAKKRKT